MHNGARGWELSSAALQALEALHGAAVAVWHLQRVLAKKRDPLSHVLFSDSLQAASCPPPLSHFWCDAITFIAAPAVLALLQKSTMFSRSTARAANLSLPVSAPGKWGPWGGSWSNRGVTM